MKFTRRRLIASSLILFAGCNHKNDCPTPAVRVLNLSEQPADVTVTVEAQDNKTHVFERRTHLEANSESKSVDKTFEDAFGTADAGSGSFEITVEAEFENKTLQASKSVYPAHWTVFISENQINIDIIQC